MGFGLVNSVAVAARRALASCWAALPPPSIKPSIKPDAPWATTYGGWF